MDKLSQDKLKEAHKHLVMALNEYKKGKLDSELKLILVSKALEVLTEYTWKELKIQVEKEGLFVASPRETFKKAFELKLIKNLEMWLSVLTARNESVHDYFSITEKEYIELADEFQKLVAKTFKI